MYISRNMQAYSNNTSNRCSLLRYYLMLFSSLYDFLNWFLLRGFPIQGSKIEWKFVSKYSFDKNREEKLII